MLAALSGKEVTSVLSSALLNATEKLDVFRYLTLIGILLNLSKMKDYQTVLLVDLNLSYSVQEQQGNQKLLVVLGST